MQDFFAKKLQLSYNSNYGESGEFVQYGPSKVGLTDCGLQCKVACGCNNSDYWYLTKPHSTHKTKAGTTVTSVYEPVTSKYEYDYIIGDDGNLASTGTTLSSAGRTLSGSSKSLSASSGEKVTCYKQTCSDGFTATKPSDTYFNYDTETLDDGSKCYKVTGCKCAYASHGNGTGATAHNGIKCYDVLCEQENTAWYDSSSDKYLAHNDNVSSQSSYCNTCYTNGRGHNYSWCDTTNGYSLNECGTGYYTSASEDVECTECSSTSSSDTCYKCAACPTKVDVGSCEVGTTTFQDDECNSGTSYYTAKRDKNHAEACGSDYTSPPSGYHCDSYKSCDFTCYNNCEKHNYSWCDTSNGYSLTECNSCQVETDSEDVECTGCSSTSTSDTCYKCRAITHAEACGTNYTAEPDDKNCTEYESCGFTCYKECKDKYYTVSVSKTFGSSCDTCGVDVGCNTGSGVAGAYSGITCSLSDRDTSSGTISNSHTISNVEAGTTIRCDSSACYYGTGFKCCIKNTSGGTYSEGQISTTVNSDVSINFHYECEETPNPNPGEEDPTWYTDNSNCNLVGASTEDCKALFCITGNHSKTWYVSAGGCDTSLGGHRYDDATQTCSGTNHGHTIELTHPANSTEASCVVVYEALCSEVNITCSDISLSIKD